MTVITKEEFTDWVSTDPRAVFMLWAHVARANLIVDDGGGIWVGGIGPGHACIGRIPQ